MKNFIPIIIIFILTTILVNCGGGGGGGTNYNSGPSSSGGTFLDSGTSVTYNSTTASNHQAYDAYENVGAQHNLVIQILLIKSMLIKLMDMGTLARDNK